MNGACLEKDFCWLSDHLSGEAQLKNVSDETSLLAIQGPKAENVLKKLTDYSLSDLKFYWSAWGEINGVEMLFSRTGYTGEDGFELYFSPPYAEKMWNAVVEAGREFDIESIGLAARDSLRLEMKYMLYGNDIDQTTNPLEAGLGWIVKLDKGDFIGKEPILEMKEKGIRRKLVAFELTGKAFPRQHYQIHKDGKKIGFYMHLLGSYKDGIYTESGSIFPLNGPLLFNITNKVIVVFDNDKSGYQSLIKFMEGSKRRRKRKKRIPKSKFAKRVKYFLCPTDYSECKDINKISVKYNIKDMYDLVVNNSYSYSSTYARLHVDKALRKKLFQN